jgi:hypothetical protein
MSYFDTTTNIVEDDKCSLAKIVYNYSRTTLNKSEIRSSGQKYFSIPFIRNKVDPELVYTMNGENNKYKTREIYIFGLIHNNITNITTTDPTIIGELVIKSTDNNNNPQYSCYLLKAPPSGHDGVSTDLDTILYLLDEKSQLTTDVALNSTIVTQNSCIVYDDGPNKVMVFTTPISISSYVAGIIQGETATSGYDTVTSLFNMNASSYSVISGKCITIKGDEEIYIDCNPVGVDTTDDTEASYQYTIPINSYLMKEKQEMDYMKQMMNFCLVLLLLVFIYFSVPAFYKSVIIDKLIDMGKCNSGSDNCFTRIRTIDFFLSMFLIVLAVIFISVGQTAGSTTITFLGIFTVFFYALSFAVVQFNKQNEKFMKKLQDGKWVGGMYPVDAEGKKNYWSGSDMFDFFKDAVMFFYKKCGATYLVCVCITIFVLLMLYITGQFQSMYLFNFMMCFITLVVLPIGVPIFKLLTYSKEDDT